MQPVHPTPPSPWPLAGKSVQIFQTQPQLSLSASQSDRAEDEKKSPIAVIAFAIVGLLVIGLLVSMICDNMKISVDKRAPQATETVLRAAVKLSREKQQRAERFERFKKEQWQDIPFKNEYKWITDTGFATMEIADGDESADGAAFTQFVQDHMECEATKQQRKQEEHTESQKMHIDAIREQNRRLHELYLELQRLEHQNRIESIETRVELKRLSNKCKVEERKRKTIDAITAIKAKIREAEEMLKAKVKSEEASNGA